MEHFKYPKTPHLPWSPGLKNDDTLLESLDVFKGKYLWVTEKMDGENTTMYRDGIHARSLDSRHHASRDWVKALHGRVKLGIPEGWRVCGENLYAQHSIRYENLPSYFMVFSVWNDENVCLNRLATLEFCQNLGLVTVPTIMAPSSKVDEHLDMFETIKTLPNWQAIGEGYVVRNAGEFPFSEFRQNIAKYVRKDHIQTDEHWMSKPVVPNGCIDR